MKFTKEDEKIGEKLQDEKGEYRMINGEKIYQIEENSESDRKINEAINRVRASGMNPRDYLNSKCI